MRLGIYRLRKAPEKRDDWIFILDRTIDFGIKKCLVVLGVTMETFVKNKCRLNYVDMRVLNISIVEKLQLKAWKTPCAISLKRQESLLI